MAWTIVRPTVLMETWAMVAGEPMLKKGKALIFGRGENPINFVSAQDVAQFVEMAVVDPDLRGVAIDVGGPENLTLNQFVETFAAMTGRAGRKTHIPLAAMRLMAVMMKPLSPALARIVHSAVVMDTSDCTLDPSATTHAFPSIRLTTLAEFANRNYGSRAA